jgi:hypothetical protein
MTISISPVVEVSPLIMIEAGIVKVLEVGGDIKHVI